jgi:hypothetical protein
MHNSNLTHQILLSRNKGDDLISRFQNPVKDTDEEDDALVIIIPRVDKEHFKGILVRALRPEMKY